MISELQNLLSETLQGMGISDVVPEVTVSDDPSHGDYSSNVAFILAKKQKITPLEAASNLANELVKDMPPILAKVEVAKPGFLNMKLSTQFLVTLMESRVRGTELPLFSARFSGKKIMIEFTDPNPFKEFHIGHLYSNIVGESISRLLEASGAEVKRVCYQGDVGLHVAKALYGMLCKITALGVTMSEVEKKSLQERARFLGEAYALGASAYEEDEAAKREIIEINTMVYEIINERLSSSKKEEQRLPSQSKVNSFQSDQTSPSKKDQLAELYTKGKKWSLEYFETIYARLGTVFWHYYFESEAGRVGLDLVREYLGKGIFEESKGAVVFPGEKYGLHTRVFINSRNLPTYEAKELGLALSKYHDYPYDLSLIITGSEIEEYFRVLLKALSLIRRDLAEKTQHVAHGMVRLPEGKMSSRKGNVLTGEWLLNEAVKRAKRKIEEAKEKGLTSANQLPVKTEPLKGTMLTVHEETEVAEMVGVGAVKWSLLRSGIGKDIEFSFDESVSFEGNSGPYLQYTFVRTQSVLRKYKIRHSKSQTLYDLGTMNYEISLEERDLLVHLARYHDILIEAAERFSPNLVTTYLFDLAQRFNLFYQKYPILKPHRHESVESNDGAFFSTSDESVRAFRLALTEAVGITIKHGLHVLGIKPPMRM